MLLSDYLDTAKLSDHIKSGLVRAQKHNSFPLVIYCYSRKCVFDQVWDDVTTKTRGLIVNTETLEVVARPFEKFFNIDTENRPETQVCNLPKEQPIVTEKSDGNLAIYYRLGDYEGIASKGSFHSPHADWGTKWYRQLNPKPLWPIGWTPVFEQICEEVEHHVVHYGEGKQGLCLLAIINNDTGEENCLLEFLRSGDKIAATSGGNWEKCGFRASSTYSNKTVEQVLAENRPNKEGYVLSWPRFGQPPLKVKVKHKDFLGLQRIKNNVTKKSILQAILDGTGEDAETMYTSTIDPFLNARVKAIFDGLRSEYCEIRKEAAAMVRHALVRYTDRRGFADYFLGKNREVAPVCFSMIDQKDHKPVIWGIVSNRMKSVPNTVSETGEEAA